MDSVDKIRKALGIEKEAVAVKYSDESPPAEIEPGKYPVCGGLLEAAAGKIIGLSKDTCACPGGITHLGLVETRQIPLKMLVEGEKLWADVKIATRSSIESQRIAKPPTGLANRVWLYPASKDLFEPDLVIFLVDAEQVSRLVTLAQFWDGKTPSFEMRGSLCWSAITYPIVSGNLNITVGDISARRMGGWEKTTLIVSVPVEKINGIADAVSRSTAGTAKPSAQFEQMTSGMRR